MKKIGSSTLILVVTCGLLKYCLKVVIDIVNPEFAPSDSKEHIIKRADYHSKGLGRGHIKLI